MGYVAKDLLLTSAFEDLEDLNCDLFTAYLMPSLLKN